MPTLEAMPTQATSLVRDVMTKEVQTSPPTALIAEVAEQMTDQNIRRVVVVDAQQRVLGVVSQRDVLRHYLATEQGDTPAVEPQNAEIQTLISRNKPVTVLPDLPLNKAAAVLAANKIGCLPVVGLKRELVGILTTTDLLPPAKR